MRQAISTILSTTLVAWGLAATPVYAETAAEAFGPCENIQSRIERSTARAARDAEQPQPIERSGNTGQDAAAKAAPATAAASYDLLALLHRLNRIDGSPMAPFRLN